MPFVFLICKKYKAFGLNMDQDVYLRRGNNHKIPITRIH